VRREEGVLGVYPGVSQCSASIPGEALQCLLLEFAEPEIFAGSNYPCSKVTRFLVILHWHQ
jgi:hypothetical protein